MNILAKMSELKRNSLKLPNGFINVTRCDYCDEKIFAVWDKHNIEDWNPYIGNSAIQKSRFKYSDIIKEIREGLFIKEFNSTIYPENLISTNARIHSDPNEDLIRFSENSAKILCLKCFKKTFNRIKFIGIPNEFYPKSLRYEHIFAASVISDIEDVYKVAKDCNIEIIKVSGKGRIEEYK